MQTKLESNDLNLDWATRTVMLTFQMDEYVGHSWHKVGGNTTSMDVLDNLSDYLEELIYSETPVDNDMHFKAGRYDGNWYFFGILTNGEDTAKFDSFEEDDLHKMVVGIDIVEQTRETH